MNPPIVISSCKQCFVFNSAYKWMIYSNQGIGMKILEISLGTKNGNNDTVMSRCAEEAKEAGCDMIYPSI